MNKLKRLWEAFEGWPPLRGVRFEIRTQLRSEYVFIEPFLSRTGERSETFPCPSPGGNGCPRRVVTALSGHLQAVCGSAPKECGTVDITDDDLVIHEFDWMKFCRFLATGLQLSGTPTKLRGKVGAWDLGFAEGGAIRRPVFFFTHRDTASLEAMVDHLLASFGRSWTALTSRRRFVSATIDESLATRDCALLGLESIVQADADGQLAVLDTVCRPNRAPDRVPPAENVFRREPNMWALTFEGKTAHVGDFLGMEYIAELLRHPRTPIEAAALGVTVQPKKDVAVGTDDERITKATAVMPGIPKADPKAIKAVKNALADRQSELTGASEDSSPSRTQLEDEISKLQQYLSQVEGHRGQARVAGGVAQRSRSRVKHAIDRAIGKIAGQHPSLGRHLEASIQTGTTLIYMPVEVPDWHF
jgi:hypothetical protein